MVGGSSEDYSGETIYEFQLAVERIEAAEERVQSLACPFCLTARAENLIRGVDDLDSTIKRLQAFETAGANVLCAPGFKSLEQIRLVVSAVNKPVNVLISLLPEVMIDELSEAGARRISIGRAMAQVAYGVCLKEGKKC